MTASGYGAIVGPGLSFAGPDQGIDFTGAGDVYTPYGAVVTRVMPGGSGWPGQGAVVNLKLLEGPAAGHYLYYAEDLTPLVKVGQKVKAGQTIARATGSGQAPGIEIGWARPSGVPLADRPPPRPADQHTAEGDSFNRFIQSVTAAGHTASDTVGRWVPGKGFQPLPGKTIPGANDNLPGVAEIKSVGAFLGRLTDPSYILRALQVLAGGSLVIVGVVLLARQVALAADLPDPAGLVTKGAVGAAATKTAGAVSASAVE